VPLLVLYNISANPPTDAIGLHKMNVSSFKEWYKPATDFDFPAYSDALHYINYVVSHSGGRRPISGTIYYVGSGKVIEALITVTTASNWIPLVTATHDANWKAIDALQDHSSP